MQGNIEANLTTIPPINIALIIGGIAFLFILLTVLIIIIVRKLNINSLGPIKMIENQSTEYHMNKATREADDACQKKMRQITSSMKLHISNIFAELQVCTIARVAISTTIRFPMYESVANNHFTTELTAYYDTYRDRIITMMKDEYVSLATASHNIHCNREALPSWESMSKDLIHCIDLWLNHISREVMHTCEKKIEIYKEHLTGYEAARDNYRAGFTKECIAKNEGYIAILKTRVGKVVA